MLLCIKDSPLHNVLSLTIRQHSPVRSANAPEPRRQTRSRGPKAVEEVWREQTVINRCALGFINV
jgi:hypothetical protein